MKSKKILLCLAIGVSFLFENNGYAAEKIEWIGDGTGYRNSLIVSGGKKLHFCGMEDKDYRVCYYYTGTSGIKPENKEAYKWFEMPKRDRRKSFYIPSNYEIPDYLQEQWLQEEKIGRYTDIQWQVRIAEKIVEENTVTIYIEMSPDSIYKLIYDYNIENTQYQEENSIVYLYDGAKSVTHTVKDYFGQHFVGWSLERKDGTELMMNSGQIFLFNGKDADQYVAKYVGKWEKTYPMSLEKSEYFFKSIDEGESACERQKVIIDNKSKYQGTLLIPESTYFEIIDFDKEKVLLPEGQVSFEIQPKGDLETGKYEEEIKILSDTGTDVSFWASFEVVEKQEESQTPKNKESDEVSDETKENEHEDTNTSEEELKKKSEENEAKDKIGEETHDTAENKEDSTNSNENTEKKQEELKTLQQEIENRKQQGEIKENTEKEKLDQSSEGKQDEKEKAIEVPKEKNQKTNAVDKIEDQTGKEEKQDQLKEDEYKKENISSQKNDEKSNEHNENKKIVEEVVIRQNRTSNEEKLEDKQAEVEQRQETTYVSHSSITSTNARLQDNDESKQPFIVADNKIIGWDAINEVLKVQSKSIEIHMNREQVIPKPLVDENKENKLTFILENLLEEKVTPQNDILKDYYFLKEEMLAKDKTIIRVATSLPQNHIIVLKNHMGKANANKYVVLYGIKDEKLQPIKIGQIDVNGDLSLMMPTGLDKYYIHICGDNYIKLKIGEKQSHVNGKLIENAMPVEIINNRSMVPLRFVAEGLGANVAWHNENKQVEIMEGNTRLVINVGEAKKAETSMAILNKGHVFVPLRYVSESMGAVVIWDNQTKSIEIIK